LISEKRDTNETLRVLSKEKTNDLLAQGLAESKEIVAAIRQFGVPDSHFAMDLSVVRGLDYYTGTIYETTLVQYPELGSICSGGRYDDLASYFTDTKLPGVGISIGLTRLFAKLREANLLHAPARTPAEVLVTTLDAKYLERYLAMARTLREAGINTEVYLETAKLKNQLAYADKKGFRLALVAGETEFGRNMVQVKDLRARTQADHALDQLAPVVKKALQGQNG
jgi:histidyl-tRNA synthetase